MRAHPSTKTPRAQPRALFYDFFTTFFSAAGIALGVRAAPVAAGPGLDLALLRKGLDAEGSSLPSVGAPVGP